MAVNADFIMAHWQAYGRRGPHSIGQGQIIGTPDPELTPPASVWTDASRARFATGNVSVSRAGLLNIGGFDTRFSAYGFEDLELGYRLEQAGWRSLPVPEAISWHYEQALSSLDWEQDIRKEQARGQGAALFYQKHPHFAVRLIAQLTPLHAGLDQLIRLGGLISEAHWQEILHHLEPRSPKLALALYRALLNRYCRQATLSSLSQLKQLRK